jgi:hypothetical protein
MIKVVAVPGHGGTGLCLLLHSFRAAAAERALLLTTVAWTWAWEYILFSSDRPVGRYGCCSHHPHVERVADLPRSNAAPCATTRNQEVCEITKEAEREPQSYLSLSLRHAFGKPACLESSHYPRYPKVAWCFAGAMCKRINKVPQGAGRLVSVWLAACIRCQGSRVVACVYD